ncbi:hypothetical protein Hanom_Chr03g00234621 [Helianthus anomalus]
MHICEYYSSYIDVKVTTFNICVRFVDLLVRGSRAPLVTPCGDQLCRAGRCRHPGGEPNRGAISGRGHRRRKEREGGLPFFSINENFSLFFLNKKTIPLRGECRHQIGVRG